MVQALIIALITFALVPLVAIVSHAIGAVDRPNHRRVHYGIISNWGGVAVWIGAFLYLPWSACLVALLGAWDGVRALTARWKLAVQIVAAYAGVFSDYDMPDLLFAIGWIVLLMNAMNLIDGVDGLASGTAITLLVAVALLSSTPSPFVLPLIGALIGFWCWNWHPAKIFLGDSGSYLIGFCLGVATLSLPWSVRLLLFAYPIADVVLAFWRRGWHWAQPDKLHIHHRLLQWWPQRVAVARLYVLVLVSTWLALFI